MAPGLPRFRCSRFLLAASLLFAQGIPPIAAADREPTGEVTADPPSHLVVLRVSDAFLNTLIDMKSVDRQTDVRDVILGTKISGRARTVGKTGIRLADSPEQATFFITFNGVTHSRTTGRNGPAIVQSRGTTTFTATKQIVFEPGRGFYGRPAKVTARTQIVVERIGSTYGGLIGRIIRRRAARIEADQHAETTAIAQQKAERRIAAAFDQSSEQRLTRLNEMSEFRYLLATALWTTGNGEPRYACSTTPQYLQLATSFGDHRSAIHLPASDAADEPAAPIELWLHETLFGDRIAAVAELLKTPTPAADALQAISRIGQTIGASAGIVSQTRSSINEQQIRIHQTGGWQVVRIAMPTEESRLIVKAKSPTPKPNFSPIASFTNRTAPPIGTSSPVANPGSRIWTSGNYTANAEFLSLDGSIVRLRRITGVNATIPLEKLSVADQKWIEAYLARR